MTLVAGQENVIELFYTRNKINLVVKADDKEVGNKDFYYDETIDIEKEFGRPTKDGFTFDHFENKDGETVSEIKAGTDRF